MFCGDIFRKLYQKLMPKMSETEQAVIAAGTIGWEGELFSGNPNWKKLAERPLPVLSQEEQDFLNGPVEVLCSMTDGWEINHKLIQLPENVWTFLKKNGFFGLLIPKTFGGKAFSAYAHAQIIAKIASVNTSLAAVVCVPNSLGPGELLLKYGTESQKQYYLPRLASGEEIPCFALTSPEAGSDASSIIDRGTVCKRVVDGKEILGISLRWNKRYITLAPVATVLGLAFKLLDPEKLLGDQTDLGITCALISTKTPGVKIGHRHFPLYAAFPNGPTQGDDVFISVDQIIGGVEKAGKGWQMLMECLAAGRAISLPSMACGSGFRAALASGAYTRIRRQFHRSLSDFEGVDEALARITANLYLADALRIFTVTGLDHGEHSAVAAAITKYHVTELGRKIISDAMDVHGGKGICLGPKNYLAQNYVEAPISITVEGANILTRSMIIFGQGVIRCHPYLLKEIDAAQNQTRSDQENAKLFDQAFFGHVGFAIKNMARTFWFALSGARLVSVGISSEFSRYYQKLTRNSAIFSVLTDMTLLIVGGSLKRREMLSARLGDLLSNLYMCSAVLKAYRHPEEKPLVKWLLQDLLFSYQRIVKSILENFPCSWLAKFLHLVIKPFGFHSKLPSDRLSLQVAKLLTVPGALRDRFLEWSYTEATEINPVGKLYEAFRETIAVSELENKIAEAVHAQKIQAKSYEERVRAAVEVGIISSTDAEKIMHANMLRAQVVQVDDFERL